MDTRSETGVADGAPDTPPESVDDATEDAPDAAPEPDLVEVAQDSAPADSMDNAPADSAVPDVVDVAETADVADVADDADTAEVTPIPVTSICAEQEGTTPCTKEKLNATEPIWEPVDVQVFAGPMGTQATSFREAFAFQDQILAPNHERDAALSLNLPLLAHDPPYDGELSHRLEELAVVPTRILTVAELTAPSGIWLALIVVPRANAPTGSTFDYESGPMLPDSRFPMKIDCNLLRMGDLVDPDFDSDFPSWGSVEGNGMPRRDGWSHFYLMFGENSEFLGGLADLTGHYAMKCTFRDKLGAGWMIKVPFEVVAP